MINPKDKYLKIMQKAFTLGGGGSHSHSISPSMGLDLHSQYVIHSFRNGDIHLSKNIHSSKLGYINSEDFLDIALKIFASKIYNGATEVFQEGFVEDAKKSLKKVLKKHSKGW